MWDQIFYVVTVPMVYLALAWVVIGVVARVVGILRAPPHPHTLRTFPERRPGGMAAVADAFAMPTVRRRRPFFWVFLGLFHLGMLALLLAHLDLLPQVNIMPEDSEHMLGHGAVGVVVTLSVLVFLFRRFRSPVREISVPADYLLLFLLFLIFISGDVISWGNSWTADGFLITKADFGVYLDNLVRFTFADPADYLYSSHYHMVVVHVLLANLFLMVLPFSKIMHTFFAVPLNRLRRV